MFNLVSVSDVLSLEKRLERVLKVSGLEVAGTVEGPVMAEFVAPPSAVQSIIDNLTPFVPQEVIERERDEVDDLLYTVEQTCREEFARDPHGRRAVVLHRGCVTYQHFLVRHGGLVVVVHMRGGDERKFRADFQYVLRASQVVLKGCWPLAEPPALLNIRLIVDCYHKYLRPEAVPL